MNNTTYMFNDLNPNAPDEINPFLGFKCRILKTYQGPASDCIVQFIDATVDQLAEATGLTFDEISFCFDAENYGLKHHGFVTEAYREQLTEI